MGIRNCGESSRSSANSLMTVTSPGLGRAVSVNTVRTCSANASDSGGKCRRDSSILTCFEPSDRISGVEMAFNASCTDSSHLEYVVKILWSRC
jgi:hypothetical protein